MSETIHFSEKFRTALAKYFAYKSVTDNAFNHNIDAEFSGSDVVHIYEIATTELNDYNKSVDPSTGSRFGKVIEVGDHRYTFRLTQDISLDRSVDRGNNDAQFNIKKAGAIMKAYTDKRIRPRKDKYRLKKWSEEAGMPSQCYGAAVACKKSTVTATPTVSISGGKATVTSTEGVVYYTLDGSDPRYQSADAKVYSAAVTVASGDIFRCCAKAEGKFMSAATTDEVA